MYTYTITRDETREQISTPFESLKSLLKKELQLELKIQGYYNIL